MALYRKYRPATFAEVVGQEHVTDPISTALDTGRISHAYLFSGPRGCGKTSSARILARSLNCAQGPTSTPCGVCPSCVALGPGGPGNLDVIELDAASHGGVDDTRELRDRAFYAPAESRYRVFIVDEAHMVTTAGFNALLKIVEEPPAHLIFIFATTEPDKVLPTIRSRTHHYPFRLLPPATMRGLLGRICEQESVAVEEAVYPLVIRAGGGSPRDSLSVLDQLLAGAGPEGVTYNRAVSLLGVTDVALIDDAVEALAADDGATLFGTVDRVMEAGHDPRRFAVDLLERFRDLILLRAVPDAIERNLVTGPGDVLERMSAQSQRLGAATLARYAELLHEGLGEMRGATAPRLLLEIVCARMLLPSVSDTESATLQRLERLERGVATGAIAPAAPSSAAPAAAPDSAPAARPAVAEPGRRRGAEALAALRAEREGASTTGPQPGQPAGQRSASGQGPAAPAREHTDHAAPVDQASTRATRETSAAGAISSPAAQDASAAQASTAAPAVQDTSTAQGATAAPDISGAQGATTMRDMSAAKGAVAGSAGQGMSASQGSHAGSAAHGTSAAQGATAAQNTSTAHGPTAAPDTSVAQGAATATPAASETDRPAHGSRHPVGADTGAGQGVAAQSSSQAAREARTAPDGVAAEQTSAPAHRDSIAAAHGSADGDGAAQGASSHGAHAERQDGQDFARQAQAPAEGQGRAPHSADAHANFEQTRPSAEPQEVAEQAQHSVNAQSGAGHAQHSVNAQGEAGQAQGSVGAQGGAGQARDSVGAQGGAGQARDSVGAQGGAGQARDSVGAQG
ncbi:DNA polymerase III subunit gamma and tau, partial [Nocardia sp. NPDC050435]